MATSTDTDATGPTADGGDAPTTRGDIGHAAGPARHDDLDGPAENGAPAPAGAARRQSRGSGARTGARTRSDDDPDETTSRLGEAVAQGIATAERDRHWQPRLVLTLALGLAGGFLLADLFGAIIGRIRPLLVSLAVALFISFALEPAVKWMHDRGMSRGAATGVLFATTTVAFLGFFAAMVPLIVDQVTTLVASAPQLLNNLSRQAQGLPGDLGERVPEWIDGLQQDVPSRLQSLAGTAGRGALNVGATVVGQVFNLLTIALVAFYLAADGPKLRRVVSSNMNPSAQREFLVVWEIAIDKTGGYLYSRVITAIVSAVFHTVVFWLIGLDYAIALGVWVGVVSSVVPVVGTYLAGILPLAIALASSVGDAAWVAGAVVTYQQVENYLIAPRITAHTVSLHPAVAFIAVLTGAALLGAFGALLAIPAAAIVSALWSARAERHEVVEHDLIQSPGAAPAPWLQRRS